MSHPLVCEYEKMSEKEKQDVLQLYKTEEHHFPAMLTSDPVSILMGFKNTEMVRVKCFYNFTKRCVDKEMPPAITFAIVTNKCE